jgi:hypothetical protein
MMTQQRDDILLHNVVTEYFGFGMRHGIFSDVATSKKGYRYVLL